MISCLVALGLCLLPILLCVLGAMRCYGGYTLLWLTVSLLCVFAVFVKFLVSFYKPSGQNVVKRSVYFVLPYIATNILSIIVLFGEIYRRVGIKPSELPQSASHDLFNHNLWTCIYFSSATWTTVGYGDFVPGSHIAEAFSSIEALLGYVAMGLMISALVNILR